MKNELEKNMKFLLKNTSVVFILKILGMSIGFIFQIILGRNLGANYYGEFTVFITVIDIFTLITVLGIDNCLIRVIPRIEKGDRLRQHLILNSILGVTVLVAIVSVTMILFKSSIVNMFKIKENEYFKFIIIIIFILSISKIIDGYLQGDKKTVVSTVFSSLSINLFKLVFFIVISKVSNGRLISAILAYLFSELIMLIIRLVYLVNVGKSTKIIKETKYSISDYKKFFKYSIYLCAISGVSLIVHSTDKLMINSMVNSSQVGIYKVSENYLGLVGVFVSPFVVFWPMISNLYKENKIDILNKIFGYITKIISLLAIPVVLFMITFSKELLSFFGSGFTGGNNILYLLLLGNVFDAVSGPVGALLNMTDYAKYNLIDMILLAVFNLSLNYFLIPKFGACGAAVATSISVITINIINIIQNKLFINVFPYDRQNLYLVVCGVVLFIIDKQIYYLISFKNIYLKMILILILNYILYFSMFTLMARPNYKKIYLQLRGKGE